MHVTVVTPAAYAPDSDIIKQAEAIAVGTGGSVTVKHDGFAAAFDGQDVVATDTWTTMRQYLQPGSKPALAIVDLQGLPEPDGVLHDLKVLMKPHRVLVLTALGTVAPTQIQAFGFRVAGRPIPIGSLVAAAARAIREEDQ